MNTIATKDSKYIWKCAAIRIDLMELFSELWIYINSQVMNCGFILSNKH